MKHIFIIDESERERILGMHKNSTKNLYLSEQVNQSPEYNDEFLRLRANAINNEKPTFQWAGQTYNTKLGKLETQSKEPEKKTNNKNAGANIKNNSTIVSKNSVASSATQKQYTDQYVKEAQTLLGFTGSEVDGKFGPKTLQKLQDLLSTLKQTQQQPATPPVLQPSNTTQPVQAVAGTPE